MASEKISDISGGIQTATNWKIRKTNELEDAENARFGTVIGSGVRRLGYTEYKDDTGTTVTDFFEAKFKDETIWFKSGNVSSNTVIRAFRPLSNTWEDVVTGLAADTITQFYFSLNEVYVAGTTASGTRIQPRNIRLVGGAGGTITVSTTRNLIGAPKAAYVGGRSGRLYLMNIDDGTTIYPDRAYESSPPMGAVTYIQAAQVLYSTDATTLNASDADATSGALRLDSVRYIKAGMAVDIYAAGTSTKTYDATIGTVNNSKDTATITLASINALSVAQSAGTVDTATEIITVASNSWMTTGTAITYTSTTPPAPLVTGTTYYIINVSATTIKLATTAALATAGTAINLTTAGSGTGYFSARYSFADNDEIWLDGRHADLSILWNLDYRTPQTADYLQIPSGVSADTSITGWYNSNNRIGIFTNTWTGEYDGANFKPVYEDIGCVSHKSIAHSGEWLIWLDSSRRVHARDSTTGSHEIISRQIKNGFMDQISAAYLPNVSASMFNNILKLNVGQIGDFYVKYIYDFDLNVWSKDTYTRNLKYSIVSRVSGEDKLYTITDTNTIYTEDTGNTDAGDTIPFVIQLGLRDFGTSFEKAIKGIYVFGNSLSAATIKIARPKKGKNNLDWKDFGQLTDPMTVVSIGDKDNLVDRYFDIKITSNSDGDPTQIDSIDIHTETQETQFSAAK